MEDWEIYWKAYLLQKFGNNIPISFTLDLGEIDFWIPPLLGKNSESFKAIQKHNAKHRVF
jgi:hypothetical protein